jgi:hypothetical protein
MKSLYNNNGELLAALAMLAPEGNVRIATVNLIDFLNSLESDEVLIDKRIILEILARGIVYLGWGTPDLHDGIEVDDHATEFQRRGFEDFSELTPEEVLAHFQKQLEIEEEDEN